MSENAYDLAIIGAGQDGVTNAIIALMEVRSSWRIRDRSAYIHPTYAEGFPSLGRLP